MGRTRALLRSEHTALAAAIVAVLVAGIVAAFLLPTTGVNRASRENGSLLAPPSDDTFSDSFGAPGAPSALTGGELTTGSSGESAPAPAPRKPAPSQPAPGETPPEDEGLLGLLPDLPIIPPPPPLLPKLLELL